jgi:glycerol dehydrogenase
LNRSGKRKSGVDRMAKSFVSPSLYVQGEDALLEAGCVVKRLAPEGRVFLVAAKEDRERVSGMLDKAVQRGGLVIISGDFAGRCTEEEVPRLQGICAAEACGAVMGLGGGRALDAAKAVSHGLGLPVVVVPTIASTDAPCSSISVIYKDSGELSRYLQLDRPPDAVLVDTGIIARAPVRFLVAGMGDALSTYFEARANGRAPHRASAVTQAALALAARCYEVLKSDSAAAVAACEANTVNEALERIVEANLLLSGLAFEGCGLAAAHAVHNGLTLLEETRPYLHGEIVAFCTIVHLVLEGADADEVQEAVDYSRSLKLPVTLAGIGLDRAGEERLMLAAEAACSADNPIGNMPHPVTPQDVYKALLAADAIGHDGSR